MHDLSISSAHRQSKSSTSRTVLHWHSFGWYRISSAGTETFTGGNLRKISPTIPLVCDDASAASVLLTSQSRRAEKGREKVWNHARASAEPCRVSLPRRQIPSIGQGAHDKMELSIAIGAIGDVGWRVCRCFQLMRQTCAALIARVHDVASDPWPQHSARLLGVPPTFGFLIW